jgi:succinate-semialdehyde dehydrogenase/glutarate-semialdehyde dehydrogenase
VDFLQLGHFIDGELVAAGEEGAIALTNPADGAEIGKLPQAGERQLQRTLDSSLRGFRAWSSTSAYERSKVLRRAAADIREQTDQLARLMTLEQGKPLAESHMEWSMCADALEWAAEEGRRAYGRVVPSRTQGVSQIVLKVPVGPTAAFAPWNFPAFSPIQKLAPALSAGCSVVLKPASDTPASSIALARILSAAGLPVGALNVVHGASGKLSQTLISSPVIRKVSLTGSVEVGRVIAAEAGRNLKKCTMELGGHAPVLVLRDAEVDRVAPLAVAAKYRNAGQVCTSPTRFLIEEQVYDRFVDAFCAAAAGLRLGDGLSEGVQMGPLVNARQVQTMERLVEDARGKGARITLGGRVTPENNAGFFYLPTVIEGAPDDARVLNEEPFGPIAVMVKVSSLDEALARANALPFGLASYCFTDDSRSIARVSRELEAGMVAFNQFQAGVIEAPFGGVKDSGFGAEGGVEGLESYLCTKFVSHRAA